MSVLDWTHTHVVGGSMYSNEIFSEYEIKYIDQKFYVMRTVVECDDIGPLDTFEQAEDVVMQLGSMLVEFEEQAWRVVAAQNLKERGIVVDEVLALPSENGGQGWLGGAI